MNNNVCSLYNRQTSKQFCLCSQNTTHNGATITNNDDIQSYETQKTINITTISTPNHNSQRISSTSSSTLASNTPTILPPAGKEYMCFLKEGKSYQASGCIKSSIITKVIDYILSN